MRKHNTTLSSFRIRERALFWRFLYLWGFVSVLLLLLTFAYYPVSDVHAKAWHWRYSTISGRFNNDTGLVAKIIHEISNHDGLSVGGPIEAIRCSFVILTWYVVWTRYRREFRDCCHLWNWSGCQYWHSRRWLARFLYIGMCILGITYGLQSLSLDESVFELITWAKSQQIEDCDTQSELRALWWCTAAYRGYTYALMLGVVLPLISIVVYASVCDVGLLRRFHDDIFFLIRAEIPFDNCKQYFCVFQQQWFQLGARYADVLGIVCLSVGYEAIVGRYTLATSGVELLVVIWMSSISASAIVGYFAMSYEEVFRKMFVFHGIRDKEWANENALSSFAKRIIGIHGMLWIGIAILIMLAEGGVTLFLANK